jgi:hypothetical protein
MAKKFGNGIDLQNQKLVALGDPTAATDGANKQYVDNVARGLSWKEAARAASTGNITIAAPGATIDGVAMAANDRFLAKDQTTGAEKGIYVWNGAAVAATRAIDADTGTELRPGTAVTVTEGTVNADKVFMIISDAAITIGTTDQTWSQFGGGNTYTAGNGINIAGNTISVTPSASGGLIVDGTGVKVDGSVIERKFNGVLPSGTVCAVTHNIGTKDVAVELREIAGDAGWETDWVATDVNTVTFTFATAIGANTFRAHISG